MQAKSLTNVLLLEISAIFQIIMVSCQWNYIHYESRHSPSEDKRTDNKWMHYVLYGVGKLISNEILLHSYYNH